jgi:hypothetical protein
MRKALRIRRVGGVHGRGGADAGDKKKENIGEVRNTARKGKKDERGRNTTIPVENALTSTGVHRRPWVVSLKTVALTVGFIGSNVSLLSPEP